jgi:type II secretory pathway pseudopilin PulG
MLGKLVGNNKGQLLIEAMVAMGIISIGLLGVFSLLANSLGLSKITSNQYVGTYLAAEGIEVVKNMIDTNVSDQTNWNKNLVQGSGAYSFTVQYNSLIPEDSRPTSTPLLFDPTTRTYNYTTGNPTVFTRTITVNNLRSGDELQVDSVVNWTDQGGAKDSVSLEDNFYNWR